MKMLRQTNSHSGYIGMLADVAMCFAAVLLAAASLKLTGLSDHSPLPDLPMVLLFATGFALLTALMYAFVGLYRPTPLSAATVVARTLGALLVGGYLSFIALERLASAGYVGQLISSSLTYLCIGMVVVRLGMVALRGVTTLPRVLIVGTGPEAHAIAADLNTSNRAARQVVGLYPTTEESPTNDHPSNPKILSRASSILELVKRHGIHEIIVAEREQRGGGVPMEQLLACRISGIPVLDLAGFYERHRLEVPIESLKASWLVYGHGFAQGRARRSVKRLFDIVVSAFLLLLLSPLMLVAAIAVCLDSPGGAIYRQQRVGLGGSLFTCLKFRSMRIDAENDGVARWAAKNDPRTTRVGAFMRKTRIDELPQLYSVLMGEMSLVGPRPERPSFVAQLQQQIPFYDIRHTVKPGVTGWAQVRYHYGDSIEDARRKHQFDLYYVKNNSIFLDFLVLIETVSVVLFREGQ